MISSPILNSLIALFATLLLTVSQLRAGSIVWDGSDSTDFNDGNNWVGNAVPGTGDTAAFNATAPANLPNLTGALTIQGITFDATSTGYTLSSGAPALTLTQATAISDAATGGTNTISSDLVFGGSVGGTQLITRTSNGGLTLSGILSGTDATATIRFGSNSATSALSITGTTNTYAGNSLITGTGSGGGGAVAVNSIGDAGANSSLGKGSVVNIGTTTTGGILRYIGSGETISTASGKTINVNGTTGGATIESSGTGALVIESGKLTFSGSGAKTLGLGGSGTAGDTLGAAIVDNGGATSLNKTGNGTWTLSGTNTFTGNATVGGGTLIVASIGNTGATTSNLGTAALRLGSTTTAGGIRYTGAGETSNRVINLNGTTGGATINHSGTAALTLSNISVTGSGAKTLSITGDGAGDSMISANLNEVGGALSLSKGGTGTWILSGTNTITGTVTLSDGLLGVTNSNALGSGSLRFGNANGVGTGQFYASGSDVVFANDANIVRGDTNNGGSTTATARFTGTQSIVFNNLTTSATNGSGGSSTRVVVNEISGSGKTLTFAGNYSSLSTSNTNALRFEGAGHTIVGGDIQSGGGTTPTSLSYAGTGSLTLNGTNSYLGSTSVNAGGSLLVNGSLAGTAGISLSNASTFRYTGSATLARPVTIGAGSTFRYDSSTPYTAVITNNSGKVGGVGTIASSVTLNSLGDVVSPGNSPGTLTFGANQSWSSFTYDWETNNFTGTTAGTAFDQVSLSDGTIDPALTLSGGVGAYEINLLTLTAGNASGAVPNFAEVNRQWTILTSEGGITGFSAANWTIDTAGFANSFGGTFSLTGDANNIFLNYAAVPEPSAVALVSLAGLGLLLLRRKSRSGMCL